MSEKLPKCEIVTWGRRDMRGMVEEMTRSLRRMGIVMTECQGTAGGDSYGFVLSAEPLQAAVQEEIEKSVGLL